MPQFDQATRDKIDALRTLRDAGELRETYELVKIEWPSGTKYYAAIDVEEVSSVAPPVTVEPPRLIPEGSPNWFVPVTIDSSIGDEEIDLKFWDGDDVMSNLILTHGEGLRVTLLYWFPQVELLLPIWEGHLRTEDEGEIDSVKVKAVQGFRSSEGDIPSRGHTQFCNAIFGGLAETQAEFDELNVNYGCNYNLQLGGPIGTLDPDTGEPWTFCPRRSTGDCTARGVNPLRHLSHRTIVNTIINTQSSGARLLSTSQGNETNLSEPVRVVMGTRRVYDMKVMAFRKDRNTNDPEHGWFVGFYEGCEGPILSMTQCRVHVGDLDQPANPATGFSVRHGNFGDVSPDISLSPHGFSATAFFRDTTGWLDPDTIQPENASGSALINGLRDIRTFRTASADESGLIATFYEGYDFDSEFSQTVLSTINYPPNQLAPPIGGLPNSNWSMKVLDDVNYIKFDFSEEYTLTLIHDDGVKLTIDGDEIFDFLSGPNGTHTGTFTPVADTWYPIQIEFKQGVSIWYLVFKWQSASQALEVVPPDAFKHGEGGEIVSKEWTRNRVWQIARMLCDKRWGNGEDYERLNKESWIAAADWVAEQVRFTDTFGNIWDHERGMSDVELIARKGQTQIEDMCMSGRLSMPFLFDGEIHIVPLRALTDEELDECPEFTDTGDNRNILWEGEPGEEKTTLKYSRKSDFDLPNRIEATYDSAADDYVKTPLQPVEDIALQLRAGRVRGDHALKKNPKKYHLLGVTGEAHGMKLQWGLLDLGPHDEGGLVNNLRITFKIWFVDALDLHIAKVIKATSAKITKYGFTHFRILNLEREDDLTWKVEAQAYNHEYMVAFETLVSELPEPPELPPGPPTPPEPDPPQCILQFGDVTLSNGVYAIPIEPCI